MSWQLVMLLQNTFAALFAVNTRLITTRFKRAVGPTSILVYGTLFAVSIVYAAYKKWPVSLSTLRNDVGLFMVVGLGFALATMLFYLIFQLVDAAVGTLLSLLGTAMAVLLATVLLGEGLTWIQLGGTLLLIISIGLILSLHVTKVVRKHFWKATGLAVLAGVLFGVASTSEKMLINHVTLSEVLVFGCGLQFIFIAALSFIFGAQKKTDLPLLWSPSFLKLALPAALLRTASGLLFIFALKEADNLSIIAVFSGFKVILAALFAVLLLHETVYLKRKLEAALLATVAIALLLYK